MSGQKRGGGGGVNSFFAFFFGHICSCCLFVVFVCFSQCRQDDPQIEESKEFLLEKVFQSEIDDELAFHITKLWSDSGYLVFFFFHFC